MSDTDRPGDELNLEAPPQLADDLRQLENRALLVPPQIDAAVLSRPRLHLARVRNLRAHGRAAASASELALAAHDSVERERLAEQMAPRGEEPDSAKHAQLTLIAWLAVAAAVVVGTWLLLRWVVTR